MQICLSASSHHPELWQPAWGIRTLLDALCAFFPTPAQGALHALEASEKDRRQMALESASWVCPVCKRPNRELVEEGCAAPTDTLPELPDQLKAQALLARSGGKKPGGGQGESNPGPFAREERQPTPDPVSTPPPSSCDGDSSSSSCSSSGSSSSTIGSSSSSIGSSSSSSSSSSSRTRLAGQEALVSRRPARMQPRSLWSQLLRVPSDRTEMLIAAADVALLLLLLASLMLLGDLLLQPPQFSILRPSPSLSS
ncbi:hypothetical protein Esti_003758 [Eimeria stiedai]